MPARTTREEARQQVIQAFMSELDRIIPSDQTVPLKGAKFIEWEDQVERLVQTVAPTVLEQRAALEENALVEKAGHCPHCGSDRVYLEKQTTQPEVISPHGAVVIPKQHARCHCCGGSFSPAEPGVVVAGGSAADAQGGGAVEPGIGQPVVCPCSAGVADGLGHRAARQAGAALGRGVGKKRGASAGPGGVALGGRASSARAGQRSTTPGDRGGRWTGADA
jgi:hypothetical protein